MHPQKDTSLVPPFRIVHQMIDLKREIETSLRNMAPDINASFLYRVIAFSLSGTTLVDLQSDIS